MASNLFQRMQGYEIRATIYGRADNPREPFIDLRRNNGDYTINAIHWPFEFEMPLGRRWFRKRLSTYIADGLAGLETVERRAHSDEQYREAIRINKPLGELE